MCATKNAFRQRFCFFYPHVSRDKFKGHSLTQILKKCFFFRKIGKKNKCFFSRNSLLLAKNSIFWVVQSFLKRKIISAFFFRPLFCFFIFPWKSLISLTHSFEKVVFFPAPGKKNGFFTLSLDFCRKTQKNKLFRGNKKFSTFASN